MVSRRDHKFGIQFVWPGKLRCFCIIVVFAISTGLITGALHFYSDGSKPGDDFYENAFNRLVKIRDSRKLEVIEYFENIQQLARGVKNDSVFLHSFKLLGDKNYKSDENLEYMLDKYYVEKYGDFYDILFVNEEGFVFHSLRKESDYHTNLFTDSLAKTKLVQQMKQETEEHFVEYEYYSPSEEPAAFFASPIKDGAKHVGWFVLQCSINHLNTVLTDRTGLGRTGEVYLVNKEKWMLTNSRFMEDCTTLRLRVDTQSVKEAFKKGVGTRIIQDYRGVRVLSAFECFDVFGTSWVAICEIDEDEVVTGHYMKHADYYNEKIMSHLKSETFPYTIPVLPKRARKRVDLNEFAKANPGERLETYGVATCTAVTVSYPGRFGYLAHIGPTDAIYAKGQRPKLLSSSGKSNFLGELISQIKHYDMYPYEIRNLEFTIVASHNSSFANTVQTILNSGVELGHIKLLYNPHAASANVVVDPADNLVAVIWTSAQLNGGSILVDAAMVEDLGAIVKRLHNIRSI